jgi:long-chain acyl-CoA synthetase
MSRLSGVSQNPIILECSMQKIWLKQYPAGVPAEIKTDLIPTLVALIDESFRTYREQAAYKFMGASFSFGAIDEASRALAAWLQGSGLQRGDRVAVMMPNVPQYPVAVAAILRAGLVVVNVNPLYTPRELEHQLKDSGAKAIVILENFATTLAQVIEQVPTKTVVVAAMGDMLGLVKGALVNHVVRRVKKLVPAYTLPGSVAVTRFKDACNKGRRMTLTPPKLGPDDIAVLQYTGGTTGVSKGAVLLHRNLVANILQSEAWYQPALAKIPQGEQIVTVCALPLYHIFGFNTNMMLGLRMGGCNILIPNPRDFGAVLKDLAAQPFHSFPAVNTLFSSLANHPDFDKVDWSHLKISVGGGMAVTQGTARLWLEKTGCPICEGYGLSETSPSATCNPVDTTAYSGTIGLPMPNTELVLLDDEGAEVPPGQPGEIAIRGPQVMAGYWQRPDETAKVMTADGFFRTGDVGVVDERGYFRIVDRKKDMILVAGFNVYPNEIEDVLSQLPGVLECAAVGIADEKSGEAVKVVIVKKEASLTEAEVRAFCEANLTGYKRPKVVEFRTDLPKTTVGKILRRELREARR